MVEATGFEPAASASRTQRSTKLSHASTKNDIYYTIEKNNVKSLFRPFLLFSFGTTQAESKRRA